MKKWIYILCTVCICLSSCVNKNKKIKQEQPNKEVHTTPPSSGNTTTISEGSMKAQDDKEAPDHKIDSTSLDSIKKEQLEKKKEYYKKNN